MIKLCAHGKRKGTVLQRIPGGIWDGRQMTGYDAASINQQLEQMHFKEGCSVKKGSAETGNRFI